MLGNREIKFRAWDGVTFYSPWIDANGNVYRSKTALVEEDNALNDTVQQYTGLKDKNGKDIYEGDVLQFEDMGEEGYEYKEGFDFVNRASVTFEDGRFTLDNFCSDNSCVIEEMHDHRELQAVMVNSEIIGNIYEHPNLLKEANNNAQTK